MDRQPDRGRCVNVVISQSMYFPWVGMLEQIRLADVFVHYDDVQFSKGSMTNRVQVKAPNGATAWMTVPLRELRLGQRIDEVRIHSMDQWAGAHLAQLEASFADAPHAPVALALARDVLQGPHSTLAELARASMLALAKYFGLDRKTRFIDSADLGIDGKSSQRVLDIVKALGGTRYTTGHGAWRYLDHDLFESAGIAVDYMDYRRLAYPQGHGPFTPYVTGLDLVAHLGAAGADCIASQTIYWKDLPNGPA